MHCIVQALIMAIIITVLCKEKSGTVCVGFSLCFEDTRPGAVSWERPMDFFSCFIPRVFSCFIPRVLILPILGVSVRVGCRPGGRWDNGRMFTG